MLRHIEKELGSSEDPNDILQANRIRRLLEARIKAGKGDIEFPPPQLQDRTRKFNDGVLLQLEQEGYLSYILTGETIRTLRDKGRLLDSRRHTNYIFEDIPSMRSQVAFNPRQLFLPESNFKNFKEQREMVTGFHRQLARRIRGIQVIIGTVADYSELVYLHHDMTRRYLFGKDYGYLYAITTTLTDGIHRAAIGNARARGMNIHGFENKEGGYARVWVAPLVVPA